MRIFYILADYRFFKHFFEISPPPPLAENVHLRMGKGIFSVTLYWLLQSQTRKLVKVTGFTLTRSAHSQKSNFCSFFLNFSALFF